MRDEQDPIAMVRDRLIEKGLASEEGLKAIDKGVRAIINDAAQFSQDAPEPNPSELYTDILK